MADNFLRLIVILIIAIVVVVSILVATNSTYDPPTSLVSNFEGDTSGYDVIVNSIPSFAFEPLITAAEEADWIIILPATKIFSELSFPLILRKHGVSSSIEEALWVSCEEGLRSERIIPIGNSWSDYLSQLLTYPQFMNPLENGFPVCIGTVCLFGHVVNEVGKYPISDDHIILPPMEIGIPDNLSTTIPKVIHQTFETRVVPKALAECAFEWRKLNPEYTWRYWTAKDRREFLKTRFPETVSAYDALHPGAFKADLWRCAAILEYGGVYADIKLFPLLPLHEIIEIDTDGVLAMDFRSFGMVERYVYNAFFAFPPNHPLVRAVLNRIVIQVKNRIPVAGPVWILDLTGPGAWRDELRRLTHHGYTEGKYLCPILGRMVILGHSFQIGFPTTVVDGQSRHVMLSQPPKHCGKIDYFAVTGKRRYDVAPIYAD